MQTDSKKKQMAWLKNGQSVPFTPENVARIPHKEGHYEFHHNGELIYVGVAGGFGDHVGDLHHRVQAYQEKDSYSKDGGHHSKIQLRKYLKEHQGKVSIKVYAEPISTARLHEHQMKPHGKFNQDNQTNEELNHGVKEHHQVI